MKDSFLRSNQYLVLLFKGSYDLMVAMVFLLLGNDSKLSKNPAMLAVALIMYVL